MEDAQQKLREIGYFRVVPSLCYKARLRKCKAIIFYCHENKLIFTRKVWYLASF